MFNKFQLFWVKLFGKSKRTLQDEAVQRQIALLQSQVWALQNNMTWTPAVTQRPGDGVLLFHTSVHEVGKLDFLEPGRPSIAPPFSVDEYRSNPIQFGKVFQQEPGSRYSDHG